MYISTECHLTLVNFLTPLSESKFVKDFLTWAEEHTPEPDFFTIKEFHELIIRLESLSNLEKIILGVTDNDITVIKSSYYR